MYKAPNGQVTVKFEKDQIDGIHTSPYVDATGDLQTVEGGQVLNVVNVGTYFGKCFIARTFPVPTVTLLCRCMPCGVTRGRS